MNDFPAAEVQGRLGRVQSSMRAQGLNGLVVYDNGAIAGAGSVRYISGYSQVPPPLPAFAFVPPAGPPTLCFIEFIPTAELNYHDIFGASQTVVIAGPGKGAAKDVGETLAEVMTKEGIAFGPVGVDALGAIPHGVMRKLRAALPEAEFTDAARLVERVRAQKSDAEIANYVRAARLTRQAMDTFMDAVRPGVRQDVAVAHATHAAKLAGADELDVIHGCGTPWYWGYGQRGGLTFGQDDLVACELNARYHGYYAQVCRTWTLGTISAEQGRLVSAVRAASANMLDAMKPGMTGSEIYHVGLRELRRRGYDWCGVRFGHGLGLTIGEGFDCADWGETSGDLCRTPITAGAVGVFHPFVIARDSHGRGKFNAIWGDPWVMREHGVEVV